MSLISRLKAVVAGDDYLDDDFDELDYESENDFNSINDQRVNHRNSNSFSGSNPFDFIHSVDSYKKLLKISEVAVELQKMPNVFIQIKLAHDPEKAGLNYSEVIANWYNIKQIMGIRIIGLMTINPKGLNAEENFELFNKCRLIADKLDLPHCSMGMSNDWEEAIKAGATWIRLGSLIFGKRL